MVTMERPGAWTAPDVRRLRADMGETQGEFALRCGIGRSYLAQIETGKPVTKVISRILDAIAAGYRPPLESFDDGGELEETSARDGAESGPENYQDLLTMERPRRRARPSARARSWPQDSLAQAIRA